MARSSSSLDRSSDLARLIRILNRQTPGMSSQIAQSAILATSADTWAVTVDLMQEPEGRKLSARMRMLVTDLQAQWQELDRRIAAFETEFVAYAKESEDARRLITIPGVGVITATALIAAIGKAETFKHGRDLAAWLGLVPRQSTTGGKPRLMGISKRGNRYLRKLLIHGARAALPHVAERDTPLGKWVKELLTRVHPNVAVVALANKLARVSWAVLRTGQQFNAKARHLAA